MVGGAVVLLIAALWWLGSSGDGNAPVTAPAPTTWAERPTTPAAATTTTTKSEPKPAKTVRMQVQATGAVFVCVQDARGKIVVDGVTLEPGQKTKSVRSSAFRVRLGNGQARIVTDGRARRVADASPQAYRVSPSGLARIPLERSPSCAAG
jgi:hypothetical protein